MNVHTCSVGLSLTLGHRLMAGKQKGGGVRGRWEIRDQMTAGMRGMRGTGWRGMGGWGVRQGRGLGGRRIDDDRVCLVEQTN